MTSITLEARELIPALKAISKIPGTIKAKDAHELRRGLGQDVLYFHRLLFQLNPERTTLTIAAMTACMAAACDIPVTAVSDEFPDKFTLTPADYRALAMELNTRFKRKADLTDGVVELETLPDPLATTGGRLGTLLDASIDTDRKRRPDPLSPANNVRINRQCTMYKNGMVDFRDVFEFHTQEPDRPIANAYVPKNLKTLLDISAAIGETNPRASARLHRDTRHDVD